MQILLVEDDSTIRTELALRWRSHGWSVISCERLADVPGAIAQSAPDLIVLDRQLPDGDGLAWLERWRRQDPNTPVMLLTARDRVMDRVEGLKRGADDYLVKPFAPSELDARIESLLRRSGAVQGTRCQLGSLLWLKDQGTVTVDGVPLDLHPREFEVLGLLMRRTPRLVAKRVLAEALAEKNIEVGDSAVEVYISRLRRKLRGSGVLIVTARGFGYRMALGAEAGQAEGED